ncbi:MAG: hypothetical protein NC408_04460 [Candidatus Gastranaerophilales bacterium]|nr:hypothetical protein [Candidatus Gastranaerophilales bacterium]MCM1072276.1 hypothetical protein [Bacteroides sp.]
MIIDRCRNTEELKKLYESRPMPSQYDFEWLVNNPNLFCFYDEAEGFLRGFITVQVEDGELTLSGTSIRGNFQDNIDAINKVCEAFKQDIYAYTPLKHAGLVLKKAGFKKIDNDRYIRRFEHGKI